MGFQRFQLTNDLSVGVGAEEEVRYQAEFPTDTGSVGTGFRYGGATGLADESFLHRRGVGGEWNSVTGAYYLGSPSSGRFTVVTSHRPRVGGKMIRKLCPIRSTLRKTHLQRTNCAGR